MLSKPSRPVLRWHGGKWRLAPWIISHFPGHRTYVEPYGGAASVLLRKKRAYAEVYNDLDTEVVGLFRVLQSPEKSAELINLLNVTPFARSEFRNSYQKTENAVEAARRLIIRAFMGFGSNAHASVERGHRSTGFRASSSRSGTTPATDWANYPKSLSQIIERFRGVIIEERNALEVMARHDLPDTLHYVDPPYLHSTRSDHNKNNLKLRMYAVELSDDDHMKMIEVIKALTGMVVLSGYPSGLYDDALGDWRRVEREALADGARKRTEVLWINPRATRHLEASGTGQQLDIVEELK